MGNDEPPPEVASPATSLRLYAFFGDRIATSLYWVCPKARQEWFRLALRNEVESLDARAFPAFSVGELGRLLPTGFSAKKDVDDWWICSVVLASEEAYVSRALSEVEGRGELLLQLIEKGVLFVCDGRLGLAQDVGGGCA